MTRQPDKPNRPATTLKVKVVPNASREQVVGMLGDAVKIKVPAPPESGKANKAVCQLVARTLGLATRQVQVVAGTTQPNKTLGIAGMSNDQARARLLGRSK
jgi:hypothetical protein